MKALALALVLALALLAPAVAEAKPKRAKCAAVKKVKKKKRTCKRVTRLSSRAATTLLGAPGGFSTPAPFAIAADPVAPPPPTTPENPDEPAPPPTLPPIYSNPRAVQVQAFEFGLQLSKSTVLSGDVRVEFNSMRAEDPHDLRVLRESTLYAFDEQAPGAVTAKTLDLSPGRWKLFCSLPEHEELGMKATLTVTPG